MKIVIGIIILVGIGAGIYYISDHTRSQDTHQVSRSLAANVQIYDVRTVAEYNSGHVKNTINLDVVAIEHGTYPDVPKDTSIALYCRSGHRAEIALDLLKKAGYTNVTSLGGLADIEARGYTLVK